MGVGVVVVVLQVFQGGQHQGTVQGAGYRRRVAHNNGHRNIFFHRFHAGHGDIVRRIIGVLVAVENIRFPVLRVVRVGGKHADLSPVKALFQVGVGERARHVHITLPSGGKGVNDHYRLH